MSRQGRLFSGRLIALLLVPSLIADPVTASTIYSFSTVWEKKVVLGTPSHEPQSQAFFQDQVLMLRPPSVPSRTKAGSGPTVFIWRWAGVLVAAGAGYAAVHNLPHLLHIFVHGASHLGSRAVEVWKVKAISRGVLWATILGPVAFVSSLPGLWRPWRQYRPLPAAPGKEDGSLDMTWLAKGAEAVLGLYIKDVHKRTSLRAHIVPIIEQVLFFTATLAAEHYQHPRWLIAVPLLFGLFHTGRPLKIKIKAFFLGILSIGVDMATIGSGVISTIVIGLILYVVQCMFGLGHPVIEKEVVVTADDLPLLRTLKYWWMENYFRVLPSPRRPPAPPRAWIELDALIDFYYPLVTGGSKKPTAKVKNRAYDIRSAIESRTRGLQKEPEYWLEFRYRVEFLIKSLSGDPTQKIVLGPPAPAPSASIQETARRFVEANSRAIDDVVKLLSTRLRQKVLDELVQWQAAFLDGKPWPEGDLQIRLQAVPGFSSEQIDVLLGRLQLWQVGLPPDSPIKPPARAAAPLPTHSSQLAGLVAAQVRKDRRERRIWGIRAFLKGQTRTTSWWNGNTFKKSRLDFEEYTRQVAEESHMAIPGDWHEFAEEVWRQLTLSSDEVVRRAREALHFQQRLWSGLPLVQELQETLPGTVLRDVYVHLRIGQWGREGTAWLDRLEPIDDARRINEYEAPDLKKKPPTPLPERHLQLLVEGPLHKLVRRIEKAGGRVTSSNAYGPSPLVVYWETKDGKRYVTPASAEDYGPESITRESLYPTSAAARGLRGEESPGGRKGLLPRWKTVHRMAVSLGLGRFFENHVFPLFEEIHEASRRVAELSAPVVLFAAMAGAGTVALPVAGFSAPVTMDHPFVQGHAGEGYRVVNGLGAWVWHITPEEFQSLAALRQSARDAFDEAFQRVWFLPAIRRAIGIWAAYKVHSRHNQDVDVKGGVKGMSPDKKKEPAKPRAEAGAPKVPILDHAYIRSAAETKIELAPIKLEHLVLSIAGSPDGKFLALGPAGSLGDENAPILIFDRNTLALAKVLDGSVSWVTTVAYNRPGGDRLLGIDSRGSLRVWNVATGQVIEEITAGGDQKFKDPRSSPAGIVLGDFLDASSLIAIRDGRAEIRQVNQMEPENSFKVLHSPSAMAICRKKNLLAVAGISHQALAKNLSIEVQLYGLPSGGLLRTLPVNPGADSEVLIEAIPAVKSLSFNPFGSLLAVSLMDGTILVFDVGTGRKVVAWPAHKGDEWSAAVPVLFLDERTLASASSAEEEETLKIWGLSGSGRVALLRKLDLGKRNQNPSLLTMGPDGILESAGDMSHRPHRPESSISAPEEPSGSFRVLRWQIAPPAGAPPGKEGPDKNVMPVPVLDEKDELQPGYIGPSEVFTEQIVVGKGVNKEALTRVYDRLDQWGIYRGLTYDQLVNLDDALRKFHNVPILMHLPKNPAQHRYVVRKHLKTHELVAYAESEDPEFRFAVFTTGVGLKRLFTWLPTRMGTLPRDISNKIAGFLYKGAKAHVRNDPHPGNRLMKTLETYPSITVEVRPNKFEEEVFFGIDHRGKKTVTVVFDPSLFLQGMELRRQGASFEASGWLTHGEKTPQEKVTSRTFMAFWHSVGLKALLAAWGHVELVPFTLKGKRITNINQFFENLKRGKVTEQFLRTALSSRSKGYKDISKLLALMVRSVLARLEQLYPGCLTNPESTPGHSMPVPVAASA